MVVWARRLCEDREDEDGERDATGRRQTGEHYLIGKRLA